MLCKPCPPDAIFITNSKEDAFNYIKNMKLIIKLGETKQFKEGDHGIFSFIPLKANIQNISDDKFINYDFRLIGYTKNNK